MCRNGEVFFVPYEKNEGEVIFIDPISVLNAAAKQNQQFCNCSAFIVHLQYE